MRIPGRDECRVKALQNGDVSLWMDYSCHSSMLMDKFAPAIKHMHATCNCVHAFEHRVVHRDTPQDGGARACTHLCARRSSTSLLVLRTLHGISQNLICSCYALECCGISMRLVRVCHQGQTTVRSPNLGLVMTPTQRKKIVPMRPSLPPRRQSRAVTAKRQMDPPGMAPSALVQDAEIDAASRQLHGWDDKHQLWRRKTPTYQSKCPADNEKQCLVLDSPCRLKAQRAAQAHFACTCVPPTPASAVVF